MKQRITHLQGQIERASAEALDTWGCTIYVEDGCVAMALARRNGLGPCEMCRGAGIGAHNGAGRCGDSMVAVAVVGVLSAMVVGARSLRAAGAVATTAGRAPRGQGAAPRKRALYCGY